MNQYRKKPVIVEAEQYSILNRDPAGICRCNAFTDTHAHGRQGTVAVNFGDWLIAESDGSGYYPCAADVFARTYEKV